MFFNKLVIIIVLFLILHFSNAQRLISPIGADCSSIYDYSTAIFSNDCVHGSVYNDFYDLDFRCSCLCTSPWNYKFDHVCNGHKRHRITCGFGGPRWYINCWSPSNLIYHRYERAMIFAHKHLPINIRFNNTSLILHLRYYINHTNPISGVEGTLKWITLNLTEPVSDLLKI